MFINIGYTHSGESFCSACSLGFTGYPNCTRMTEEQDRGDCPALILPHNLDTPAYLGFTGRMHIQDKYFIDSYQNTHQITFTIKKPSYIRLYIEPRSSFISVVLLQMNDQGQQIQTLGRANSRT